MSGSVRTKFGCKPGVHVAIGCNATSCMGVSCSQSKISDTVTIYVPATICRVASRCNVYAGKLQTASTRTDENEFYVIKSWQRVCATVAVT